MKCFEDGLQKVWIFVLIFDRENNIKLYFSTLRLKTTLKYKQNSMQPHMDVIPTSKCFAHTIYTSLFYRNGLLESEFSCTERF